jgi:hypothetical protein
MLRHCGAYGLREGVVILIHSLGVS